MSRPVDERLRDLETEVRDLRVLPAAAIRGSRASGSRRRARVVVGLLALAAVVAIVAALIRDTQAGAVAGPGCPPGTTEVDLTIPDEASQVELRVLNGTASAGIANQVSTDFGYRGFRMRPPASGTGKVTGVAVIRYGPRTVGAADWIQAYFLGRATPQYSASRTTDVIDVVVGDGYRQLATRTEVNEALAMHGGPALPPGGCDAVR